MNFQSLENNAIIIIPNQLKEKILLDLNMNKQLINIKIMSLDEFKKRYYFDFTTETIYFLMQKYNFPYDFCLDIINNLYYINSKKYKSSKLDFLVQIKEELMISNLLKIDPFFKINVHKRKIYIYGYDYIDNFSKKMFDKLNVEIIKIKQNNYSHDIYEFENIDEEVNFLANQICELIINGTPINKIKIINPSSEYLTTIKRTFKMFKIPFNLESNYLISTNVVSKFLDLLDDDIEKTLKMLKEVININNELVLTEYNQIIKICNKYNWCSNFRNIKNLLIEEFKREKIELKNFEQKVEFVSLENNIFNDDEFIFLIGFNQNNYPKIYKDDSYIDDSLKQLIALETTFEKNNLACQSLVKKIKNIKNLTISYKLKTPFNTYYKSQVIDDQGLNIVKVDYQEIHYSVLNDQLLLANILDTYLKYGERNNNLDILLNTYPNIDYKTYSNQYTKIDETMFMDYLNNKLTLSYSSVDNFYRCGFRYYADNILKLNISNNDFSLFIGNLFHYILSIMYNPNFDFETSFNNYVINNYNTTSFKEKFFIQKLKKELMFIIDTIKDQEQYITFDQHLFEETVKIDLSTDKYEVIFKGIIDKIMYKCTNGENLIAIIDYKTGNPNLNLNNIVYGLDMQLCIYAYLSSKMKKFDNPRLVGIYLQKILNKEISIVPNKDYVTLKKENLKLQGYSTNNENILRQFDNTYQDSNLIKGLKISSKGFYHYSKILSQEMLEQLLKIIDKNIYTVRDKILNREFFINPKKIGIKNLVGCDFCKYRELCFMKENDIVNLKEYKNLEFLGGEESELD